MRIKPAFCLFLGTLVAASSVPAAQLTWDPLENGSGTGGSGNWDTTAGNTDWYNGSQDILWSQTSTTAGTMGATFGGGDGSYTVSLDSTQMAVTNLTINNSGYTFSGIGSIYLGSSQTLSVAAGKTVTFNCNMAGSGTSPFWTLGAGATMNVGGNLTSGQQLRMAGAAGSVFNLTGTGNAPAILFILGTVNLTSGSLIASSTLDIGYPNPNPINGVAYTTGTFTESGSSTLFQENGNLLIIGRGNGTGTFTLNNGTANICTTAAHNLAIDYDSSANSSGTVNVNGGTLNVGSSSVTGSGIDFFDTAVAGSGSGATAVMTQTGGIVNTWGGVIFGPTSGSFVGGSAALTNSGGFLYVGAKGIALNTVVPPTINITLSGGTIGALASWSSSMPMTLATLNGNITFQCADGNGSANNITLSGALTGPGGFNVTGSGVLSLSGANSLTAASVVSNGTLAVVTSGSAATYGPISLDGSAGSPILSARVSNRGQSFSAASLAYVNGPTTADFQYGSLTPSTSVGAIQVSGSVAFTSTPTVTVEGTALAAGTYPLIQYTGTLSGTVPTTVTLPSYASGYITNLTATKTIALVVASSTFSPAFTWAVGNGAWDMSTFNWKQFGSATNYTDGDAVLFDDSASGTSPITITLSTAVNPASMTANNTAKSYVIAGSGSIEGASSLEILGGGTLTLSGTNAYSGGTEISSGHLNINNGGNATSSSIGAGTLTVDAGAFIDNTSASDVTLQSMNLETWNGNFTYTGSMHNFNTGTGAVTMNQSLAVNVASNDLVVGGSIGDNGYNYQLTKTGTGALTLAVGNGFGGGLTLQSGTLNLGDPNAPGSGQFAIFGGAIDNVSGQSMQLTGPASYSWGGSFSVLGTTNLDLGFSTINILNGLGNISLNVVTNTLMTEGVILNNNTAVTKTGAGTWVIAGSSAGNESLGLIVSAGEVDLDKLGGQSISGGNNVGMTVQTGGLVVDENSYQIHSGAGVTLPVNLSGGVWDLNGYSENVDTISISSGGILRNSAALTSTLNLITGLSATLTGTNCQIDVAAGGTIKFEGIIAGSGTLVKTSDGLLDLTTNEAYTGETIIGDGTIALPGFSSISNTAGIDLLTTNSALDLSGNTDTNANPTPVLTLNNGQFLSGYGVVTGMVVSLSGSTIAPGSSTAVGILTATGFSGASTLGGFTSMKLDKGHLTNDVLSVSGNLVYGGTLVLTNLSGSLAPNDSFTLFNAGAGLSGAFSSISPSRPGFPGFGLAWNTNSLTLNGSISIMAAAVPPPPKITTVGVAGSTLMLQGTNGLANEPFVLLESTNLTTPPANWTPVLTNSFDGAGDFNISFGATSTPEFFKIQVQ